VCSSDLDDSWPAAVRQWFRDYYIGKTHAAATGLVVARPNGERLARVVRSEVTFRADGERWVDWYIRTGEPRNKAGGYAIQGAGSVFIERVEGSLSNVVGLPLAELMEVFRELGVDLT
jgi:septum formation protein